LPRPRGFGAVSRTSVASDDEEIDAPCVTELRVEAVKRSAGRFTLSVSASVGVFLVVASCGQTQRELKPDELEWECWDQESLGCDCVASERAPGAEPKAPPTQCSYDDCCLLDLQPEDDHLARCDCFPSPSLCEQEIAKRSHLELVDQCPPNPEGAQAPLCAAEGEDCSRDYLIANGLDGCCDLACLPNEEGGRTCQAAGGLETLHIAQCSAALENSLSHPGSRGASYLELVTKTLSTSLGTFELDHVGSSSFSLGEGGCVSGLSVTFLSADEECVLTLGASLVEDSLVVDTFQASFGRCAGYLGTDSSGLFEATGEIPFAVEIQGLSCESTETERTCFGGEFAFLLDGALPDHDELVFDEQLVLFTGGICAEASGGCGEP
jgi:hypothetical protein